MERASLLFVDDEESIRLTLPEILKVEGFDVTVAASVSEALALISQHKFDILLSDLNINQRGDGFTVVSAMRSMQPMARTFILTGYPNFDSALEGIRQQVDDYLIKPADVPTLLKVLRSKPEGARVLLGRGKRVSAVVRENVEAIIANWVRVCDSDPQLANIRLPERERIDHLPGLLDQLAKRLDKDPDIDVKRELESASAHGRTRRLQGYTVGQLVAETHILHRVIADELQAHLVYIDMSFIIPDMVMISDNLNRMLEESLRSFLSSEPVAA